MTRMSTVLGDAAAAAPATVPFEAGAVPVDAGTEPSAGALAAGRSCSSSAYAPPKPAPQPTRPAISAAATTPAMPRPPRRVGSAGGRVGREAVG
jgi:hypothetical protein